MTSTRRMRQLMPIFATCGLAALLASCGSSGAALPSTAMIAVNPAAEYVVGGADELAIHFTYNAGMDVVLPVQQDGRITLPMVGQVLASGTTPKQLSERITGLYATILQRPDVVVSVRAAVSQRIYVAGEVGHPGVLVLEPDMNITSALTAAGGLKDSARLAHVILIRRGADGLDHAYWVDVGAVLNGRDSAGNARLAARDIVFVPKSAVANVNMGVKQFLHDNIPIGVALPL